jgi:uncharacterized protein YqfA (UPF0365 family)
MIFIVSIALICFFIIIIKFLPTIEYITAKLTETPVSMSKLISLRKVSPDLQGLVNAYIPMRKSGIEISIDKLKDAQVEKLDLIKLVNGMIWAKTNNVPLTFEQAKEAVSNGMDIVNEFQKATESKKGV